MLEIGCCPTKVASTSVHSVRKVTKQAQALSSGTCPHEFEPDAGAAVVSVRV